MSRRVWSPGPLAFGGTDPAGLAEREAEAIVAVLRREGPLDGRTLRARVEARLLGTGPLRPRPAARGARRPRAPRRPAHLGRGRLVELDAALGEQRADVVRRIAGELGAGGQREQLAGLLVDLVAAEGEVGRDGGGELHGRVLGLRIELAGLLGDALGGDLRAVAAERLVVVLEALQQVLDAGVALGVDGDHGAVDDGGERDGFGVGGHARRVPAWPRAKRLACGHGHHRRTGHGRHGRSRWPATSPAPATRSAPGTAARDKAPPLRDDGVDVRDDPRPPRRGRRRRADHARRRRRGARRRAAGEPRRGADLVAGVHHRDRGDRAVRGARAGDRRRARRRAGARHQAAGRGGQARGPGLRPRLRARRAARRSSTRSGSGPCASGRRAPRRGSSSRSTCGSWP